MVFLLKIACDILDVLSRKHTKYMKGGMILVIIGALFLLKNIGFLEGIDWDIIWPIAIIVIGLNMFFKKRHCLNCGTIHGGTCTPR